MAFPDLNLRYIPRGEELLAISCLVENTNLPHITDNSIIGKAAMYTSMKKPRLLITPDEYSDQELCDSGEACLFTEEEMMAIEQLTRLKRRGMEEEEEEELSSYNSEYLAVSSPLTGLSHPSSYLDLASTQTISTTSEIAPLKDFIPASSGHEALFAEYSSSTSCDLHNDINIFVNIEVDELEDQDMINLTSNFDELRKPKIRMLSDIYSCNGDKKLPRINDTARSSSPAGSSDKLHNLCNINKLMSRKRRRKSVNMLITKKPTVLHQ